MDEFTIGREFERLTNDHGQLRSRVDALSAAVDAHLITHNAVTEEVHELADTVSEVAAEAAHAVDEHEHEAHAEPEVAPEPAPEPELVPVEREPEEAPTRVHPIHARIGGRRE